MRKVSFTARTTKRAALLAAIFCVVFSGCAPPRGRQANFFSTLRATPPPIQPPQDRLLVWLEGAAPGGGSYLRNGSAEAVVGGPVTNWADVRGGARDVPAFRLGLEGRRSNITITARNGSRITVPALTCGDPNNSAVRCAYVPFDPGSPATGVRLDSTPYTILAVVRRRSARGDNYFIMTNGGGSCGGLGGILCATDSALHVGWSGETTARLGQYGDDSVLDPVPAFDSNMPVSLFVARNVSIGKQIAVLEVGFNFFNTEPNTTRLTNSGALFIGGTPFGVTPGVPDWRFVGDIFAVLVYGKELDPNELFLAQDYLRTQYGPR